MYVCISVSIYIYHLSIYVAIGEKTEKLLSSIQACFVIAQASRDFIVIFVPSFIYFINLRNNTSIVTQ